MVWFDDLGRRGVIATTCVWFRGDEIVESDTELDTSGRRWTTRPGPRCIRSMDIPSVMVHETGHTFGLGHPSGNHPALSMNSIIMSCSTAFRTLGYGDMRGLRVKYGSR